MMISEPIRFVAKQVMAWMEKQGDTYGIRADAPAWVKEFHSNVHWFAVELHTLDGYVCAITYRVLEALQENDCAASVVEAVVDGQGVYTCHLLQWLDDCRAAIRFVNRWRTEDGRDEIFLDDILGDIYDIASGFRLMVEAITNIAVRFLGERAGKRKGKSSHKKDR